MKKPALPENCRFFSVRWPWPTMRGSDTPPTLYKPRRHPEMTHSTKQPHPQPGPSAEAMLRALFRLLVVIAIAAITTTALLITAALGTPRPVPSPTSTGTDHYPPPPPSLWKASGPPFQPFSNLPGPLRQLHQAPDFDQLRDVRTSRDRAPIKSPEIAPSSRGSTSTRLGSRHTRHPQPPAGSGNPSHGKRDSGFSR